ncbi:MAG TPA: acyl-CoA dehydratase activase [Spirochaetota bacterium]
MKRAGIDVGSRSIKLVVLQNDKIIQSRKKMTSHDPIAECKTLLDGLSYDSIIATGYGRHLVKEYLKCGVVSEIKAFSIGARYVRPQCSTVLDIGGQDTKVLTMTESGKLDRFEMNDKCAAGTGRFLEIMATALGLSLSDFIVSAVNATKETGINATCTVFAESEVISLITQGVPRDEISRGIHRVVARRAATLLQKFAPAGELLFAGGVAYNDCIRSMIEEVLGIPVFVPEDPQLVGAIGSALAFEKE